jgi:hypothetical protein
MTMIEIAEHLASLHCADVKSMGIVMPKPLDAYESFEGPGLARTLAENGLPCGEDDVLSLRKQIAREIEEWIVDYLDHHFGQMSSDLLSDD